MFGLRNIAQPLEAGVDALQEIGFSGTFARRSSAHAFAIGDLAIGKVQCPSFKKLLLLHGVQVGVGKHGFGVGIVGSRIGKRGFEINAAIRINLPVHHA